ncbi:ATP-binding protein [Peristeroidobacter soli]|uniref:ATP-binding protein n=1 Tax=Peristeroidobacter soli TaxID=2497877 RepID=UPI0013004E3B|nr:ATP-binding protein [Peristeroidobacter soli]
MSFVVVSLRNARLTFFGLRGERNPNSAHKVLKPFLKGRFASIDEVKSKVAAVEQLLHAIDSEFLGRQSEMLEPLHDPARLARQIDTIAGRLMAKILPEGTDEERFQRADSDLRSLVKAAGFLSDSFDLLTIYFNPAAASFGRKSFISLHGLLLKLAHVFRIQDGEDGDAGSRIFLSGQSFKNVRVFDSFKLVPFALISNAVKYSLSGAIRIAITERLHTVEVMVESQGPYIEDDEIQTIFNKRQRGRWARQVAEGRGVGLYLAQVVARANGSEIRVSSQLVGNKKIRGVPLATNRFSFELLAGAARE